MKKYAKIINDKTKEVQVGAGCSDSYYIEIGMTKMDVEEAYNGLWYVDGYAPEKPEPTKEDIRKMRAARFSKEADPIRYDYDEALARGDETAEELKQAWLAKKDEIREDLPYPVEND